MDATPTYRIVTLGCKLNQADTGALEARLRGLGMRRAGDGSRGAPETPADVVVLNTCTVTAGADREARQIARRLRRANPRATLIATGCYAERDGKALATLSEIDHVVGMRDQAGRVSALAARALGLAEPASTVVAPGPAGRAPAEVDGAADGLDLGRFGATDACDPLEGDRTRAFLKIQDGCDLRCSYCVIPSVRGPSRSLPADEVLRRIAGLAEAGYREIVFTGVNTGSWGADLEPPRRLDDLIPAALAAAGPARLRLNSLEPRTVTPAIVRHLAESSGGLARHLQIPLQSGCDAVLARMRRNYRTADYRRVVDDLRDAAPDAAIGADVIVGFPGETEEEFETTCRFIAASPLAYLHVFSYSSRPGTAAAGMPAPIAPAAIRERSARLREMARDLSLRFRRRFVGRTLPALVLREVRPDGRLRALTDNFIDVSLEIGRRRMGDLVNRIVTARLTAADRDGTLGAVV
jgi:threonylcarbamoyladenosine tRNA methylthiotransferase MtaB